MRCTLLHIISSYVNTSGCRRKYILNYFGQNVDWVKCANCDNCNNHNNVQQKIPEKEEYTLFQILNTIVYIQSTKGYSFGTSIIVLILKGSAAKKVQHWMTEIDYYGSMKNIAVKNINEFIRKAVDLGYIEDHDVGNCVKVLRCTDYGKQFCQEYEKKLANMINNKDKTIDRLVLD